MSLGALTTTFTPDASCLASSNIWRIHTTCPGNDGCYYLLQGPPVTSDCMPTNYNYDRKAYYSPAYCPAGYTAACSSLSITNRITETQYTCCPTVRDFSCLSPGINTFTGLPFQSYLGCVSGFTSPGTLPVTVSSAFTTSTGSEVHGGDGGAINAFAVRVRFQATDFVSTTTSPSPSSTPATPASSPSNAASQTSSASATPTNSSAPSSSGLSTGAKAGIGIGAALGAIAVAALLFLVYRMGKRRNASAAPLSGYPEMANNEAHGPPYGAPPQYGAKSYAPVATTHQVPAQGYYGHGTAEAHTHEVHELPGQIRQHEMS
ncbi:hypothetical protein ACN47E_007162 [Coniothyrium glycines]